MAAPAHQYHPHDETPALLLNLGAVPATNIVQQCLEPKGKNSRYALGLFFILVQCVVWIVAAVVAQKLFSDYQVPPFLLTYIGMSLLALLLPIHFMREQWATANAPPLLNQALQADDNHHTAPQITESLSVDSLAVQLESAQHCTDYMDFAHASTHQLANDHVRKWNHRKHITAALWLTPAMFVADYMFNKALAGTSVASATVLVSTQSLWVFLLAALVFHLEPWSIWKLGGVIAGVAGTALTAYDDVHKNGDNAEDQGEHAIGGDVAAVVAALLYAIYTIQVKKFCPENEDLYSMSLLLGYIGLICTVAMAPIGIYMSIQLHTVGEGWTWVLLGMICAKGILDFMVTDYCLFRAILLTNATVATVGLGLTIPMAFCADFVMGKLDSVTLTGVAGTLAIAIGFLIVNLVPDEVDHTNDNKDDTVGDIKDNSRPAAKESHVML